MATEDKNTSSRLIAVLVLLAVVFFSALAAGQSISGSKKEADAEDSAVDSSQLKSLTPEEAEKLICTDTETRTFDRVYRISVCKRVVEGGVSVCKDEVIERTLTVEVDGSILDLNGLEQLSADVAQVLARHNGFLDLNGLKSLSDAAATELIGQNGSLNLDGLEAISHETADALNRHAGPVSLNGLKQVSAAAYETLRTKRNARLPNTLTLTQVSDGVIVWKREHPGSFKQYATQLADRFEVQFAVDNAVFDKYGLSQDRILPPPPLAAMSPGQAGNWLADQLSQRCPVEIVAGWGNGTLRFFGRQKTKPQP